MFVFQLIFLGVLILYAQICPALDNKDILRPEQAFKISASATTADKVQLSWEIVDGYHLYRDKFKFESKTEAIKLGQIDKPAGLIEHDAIFGDVAVYRGVGSIDLRLQNPNKESMIKLFVSYQGCADAGVCYPPQKAVLDVPLPIKSAITGGNPFKQLTQGFKNLAPEIFQKELLPPEQAFQFFATVIDAHTLHVSWLPAEGYYLYKNKLALTPDTGSKVTLGKYALPHGESHHDPEFGEVEVYRQEVNADVPLLRSSQDQETVTLVAKYQGCADRGVCYPPITTKVNLVLPAGPSLSAMEPPPAIASEQDKIADSLKNDTLPVTLLTFFGFGLLLAFTPCIFPMIPILSGIIVGQGEGITTRKAFLLSLCYVLASAAMYTLFGILAALFGSNLQAAFQEPWVIALFSALFVALSLSMFGFYNLELPASLQSKLMNSSGKHRDGSYLGAGLMGGLSSLIVGPCVAAPLAAALIYIGQSGDVLLGGSALFMMGLGMGMPLLLLGASAGKLLPKSGAWLNSTKAVFGVIMLAVAVWMLSRILPSAITMLLSALLLIIPAMFLRAIDPLPVGASGWCKLWKGLGFVMLVFGILELLGLSAGNRDLFQPLKALAVSSPVQAKSGLMFERVRTVAELEAKIKQAGASGKRVMLDFYADWCVSCKEMEVYTFSDAEVQRHLANFVLLQADVTENNQDDKALLKRFDLIGPPGMMFFDLEGRERKGSRVIGYQDADTFIKTLQQL